MSRWDEQPAQSLFYLAARWYRRRYREVSTKPYCCSFFILGGVQQVEVDMCTHKNKIWISQHLWHLAGNVSILQELAF